MSEGSRGALYLPVSFTRFSFPMVCTPYSREGKMWKAYDSNLWRGNYTFVHIYIKGTEREELILSRSSFRSVPFGKKGIVKKKRNRYFYVPFL